MWHNYYFYIAYTTQLYFYLHHTCLKLKLIILHIAYLILPLHTIGMLNLLNGIGTRLIALGYHTPFIVSQIIILKTYA